MHHKLFNKIILTNYQYSCLIYNKLKILNIKKNILLPKQKKTRVTMLQEYIFLWIAWYTTMSSL